MAVNVGVRNGNMIHNLSQSISTGIGNINVIPKMVEMILLEGMWKKYVVKATGQEVAYNGFKEFVESPIPIGLGTTVDVLKRLCGDDLNLLTLISEAVTLSPGSGPSTGSDSVSNNPVGSNQHTKVEEDDHDNIMVIQPAKKAPQGTSKEYGLRRLKKEAPELHEAVVRGEKSVNAACIDAGFRKRPSPMKKAQEAVKKMSPEELEEFKLWLQEYEI